MVLVHVEPCIRALWPKKARVMQTLSAISACQGMVWCFLPCLALCGTMLFSWHAHQHAHDSAVNACGRAASLATRWMSADQSIVLGRHVDCGLALMHGSSRS